MRALASKPKHPEPTKVVDLLLRRQALPEAALCSLAQTSHEIPLEERWLWEAAIQLDLVTVNTAKAQITQGKTVAEWTAWQMPGAVGDRQAHPGKAVDKALLLVLAMSNLAVLVVLGTATVLAFSHLF